MAAIAKKQDVELDDYEGITPKECPILCESSRCVITGEGICGHPHKGGLQSKYQIDPACQERYRQARIRLAQQRIKEM
jgi:hypothetical protein